MFTFLFFFTLYSVHQSNSCSIIKSSGSLDFSMNSDNFIRALSYLPALSLSLSLFLFLLMLLFSCVSRSLSLSLALSNSKFVFPKFWVILIFVFSSVFSYVSVFINLLFSHSFLPFITFSIIFTSFSNQKIPFSIYTSSVSIFYLSLKRRKREWITIFR